MPRKPAHEELERKLRALEPGDHLCCIYEGKEEHRAVLTPFMRQGLERGEKVFYVVDTRTAGEVLGYLRRDGLEVEPYLESGQLAILTADQSYLREGVFDPDGMISLLEEETRRALEDGYSALRVTGEMTWALKGLAGSERLIEYEAKLNDFFPGSKCLAICQYDRRRFGPEILLDVLTTHPIAVIGTEVYDNFYYMPPEDFLGPDPAGARLDNWVESLAKRKGAEAQIIRAKEEWERTFDAVPDSIMILDGEYRVVRVNKATAERLGCAPRNLVGKICYEVFHGAGKPTDNCPHTRLIEDGLPHRAEVHEDRLGGVFLVSVNPLHDSDGKLTGSVHVARDITERKRAEEALQKAHDELERRVEERTAELQQEIKDRKQAEDALRESENQLRHLSSQLLSAQEDERKSVAQDLHDSIGQTLSAIKFGTEQALGQLPKRASRKIRKPLESIIAMVQNGIEEIRRIQMALRPSTLDDLGILATISWFCREFQNIYSKIRIEKRIDIKEDEVPDPLKTIIYRVMQEALGNIAKHSGADLVRLSLRKAHGTIELAIEDNGLGFDLEGVLSVESSKRGIGISSMKERIELSGGSFAIESAVGTGTIIRASWPEHHSTEDGFPLGKS
jgi:PAS domain S-box-containing protein